MVLISAFPHHLWIKVTTVTAKITKAANTANTAKNEKQEKIMKAGRAGPFHIRKDKSMHRLTASAKLAKEIEMMIFWAVRVGRVGGEVSRPIFRRVMRIRTGSGSEDKEGGEVCIVCRLNHPQPKVGDISIH